MKDKANEKAVERNGSKRGRRKGREVKIEWRQAETRLFIFADSQH